MEHNHEALIEAIASVRGYSRTRGHNKNWTDEEVLDQFRHDLWEAGFEIAPIRDDEPQSELDMARQLIQAAKGVDGPDGGFVTDHLDAAENHLDNVEAAIRGLNFNPSGAVKISTWKFIAALFCVLGIAAYLLVNIVLLIRSW